MTAARSDEQWEWLFVTEGITAKEDLILTAQAPHTPSPLHVQAELDPAITKAIPL